MPEENGRAKDLTKDQVEKVARELDPVIRIDENQDKARCQCGSIAFIVIVTKNQTLAMGAHIVRIACLMCQRVSNASERGNLGEKNTYQDADGRNHYHLKCDTGYLGTAIKKNKGN